MFDKEQEQIANSAPEAQEIIVKGMIAVAAPDRLEEIESRANRMMDEFKNRVEHAETEEDKAVEFMVMSLFGIKIQTAFDK